jgi:hypothetical protein
MNIKIFTAIAGLFLMAAVMPTTAYHSVYPARMPDNLTPVPLNAGDWVVDTSGATACESFGKTDDRNSQAINRVGLNGLCTSGLGGATGTAVPPGAPAFGIYTVLDLCDAESDSRDASVGKVGPLGTCLSGTSRSATSTTECVLTGGVPPCTGNGRVNAHGYRARVGAFTCTVPTNREFLPVVNEDFKFWYDELYAWYSFTAGDGYYETGLAPTDGVPDNDNPPPPGSAGATDEYAAYHGHVTVFPDLTRSETGASNFGSVAILSPPAGVAPPAGLADNAANGLGGGGHVANNCAGSPSAPPSGVTGPAFVAPYAADLTSPSGQCHPIPAAAATPPGATYVVGSTAVVKVGVGPNVDDGTVVLAAGGRGPNVGGACVSRAAAAVGVVDAVGGANTVFQACMDMDNDGDCEDESTAVPPTTNPCPDAIFYSHQNSLGFPAPGLNSNPMALAPPVIAGCPGNNNNWVVFVCTGVHSDAMGPHKHESGGGTVAMAGAGGAAYTAATGGFCSPASTVLFTGKLYTQL